MDDEVCDEDILGGMCVSVTDVEPSGLGTISLITVVPSGRTSLVTFLAGAGARRSMACGGTRVSVTDIEPSGLGTISLITVDPSGRTSFVTLLAGTGASRSIVCGSGGSSSSCRTLSRAGH